MKTLEIYSWDGDYDQYSSFLSYLSRVISSDKAFGVGEKATTHDICSFPSQVDEEITQYRES